MFIVATMVNPNTIVCSTPMFVWVAGFAGAHIG